MSLRLTTAVEMSARPEAVWSVLTDWAGQSRWIPFTTVRIVCGNPAGVGGRAEALSGFWLGRIPVGLLDRFVVTGWTPPTPDAAGELEVLHLGPYFTGEGVFRVESAPGGSRVVCTELFALPAGQVTERLAGLLVPVMRLGLTRSLRSLGRLVEQASGGPAG